jgi:hypothetical protein
MNRARLFVSGAAAVGGFAALFVLLMAYVLVADVIEPGRRIAAFLVAAPHHRHPLQLAAAGALLHAFAGAALGIAAMRGARLRNSSPWHLLLCFAIGYLVALVSSVPGDGRAILTSGPTWAHTAALLLTASGCILTLRRSRRPAGA